jgi:hypothetical protein
MIRSHLKNIFLRLVIDFIFDEIGRKKEKYLRKALMNSFHHLKVLYINATTRLEQNKLWASD